MYMANHLSMCYKSNVFINTVQGTVTGLAVSELTQGASF